MLEIGSIAIDYESFISFFTEQSTLGVIFGLYAVFGWIIFVFLCSYVFVELYVGRRQDEYKSTWKWITLAIDIPTQNIQTPKAVEQFFAHLAGAYTSPDIKDKFRDGFKQRWFSFEIISIEGYIQFIIRTEESFRDLVEAALYAQYPDAEVVEIEDYTQKVPETFPDDEYDMWAADFTLAEDDAYPIRTHFDFQDNMSKDVPFKDPMAAFLESFSRIGAGEQIWFQILIEPISSSWKDKAIKKIKETIGEKVESKKTWADSITAAPLKVLEGFGDQVFGREASENVEKKDDGPQNKLQSMTPGEGVILEGMEKKISKIGFKTKLRGLYLGRKEVFRPERGVTALAGSINQFNAPSSNSLVPSFSSGSSSKKKNLLLNAYKKRKITDGKPPFILNIEELATIWHFPLLDVKVPSVQKSVAKRVEPPVGLPVEFVPPPISKKELEEKKEKPTFQTDAGDLSQNEFQEFG